MMEKVVAAATMDGFNIRNTSNFQIIMGKPVTNPLVAGALAGSRYDSTPESRLLCWTFADIGNNCTHIGIAVQIVTNPGSGFERIMDVSTGKDAHDLQSQLETLKLNAEGVDKIEQLSATRPANTLEAWKVRRGTFRFFVLGFKTRASKP